MKKTLKSTVVVMTITLSLVLSIQSSAHAQGFSTFKQKVVYSSTEVDAEIGVTRDGITFKYKSSGSDPVAIKNYCGFWIYDTCDPNSVNGFDAWPE